MWKSKHHTWILRHFSQVLDSLGEFGTATIPTLTIQKWRYRQPHPNYRNVQLGWDIALVVWGGWRGLWGGRVVSTWTTGVLTAHLAVVKRLVFNCAFMRVTRVANHVVPPVLLHSLLSAVTSNSKLLNVRGKPLHFLSKKICPSYRKTNSIALQGYINWVTESVWRTEALLTHIHGAMCLLNEISTRK